jgi:LytS/YehU family sensor histidine kinase
MFKNKTPFQAGLIFGLMMVVFTAIYQYFEGAEINVQLLISSLVGGVVGGSVYGGIEWLKRRKS